MTSSETFLLPRDPRLTSVAAPSFGRAFPSTARRVALGRPYRGPPYLVGKQAASFDVNPRVSVARTIRFGLPLQAVRSQRALDATCLMGQCDGMSGGQTEQQIHAGSENTFH